MEHIKEDLFNFNPWWEKDFDPHLHKRERFLKLLRESLKKKEIIILTGLRRVGKSSIMKLLIQELCATINPKKILYISLDSIAIEHLQISELIREFRKLHNIKRDEKIYLFFDEATYRDNINIEIKNLYDSENVKFEQKVVLTPKLFVRKSSLRSIS